MPDFLLEIGCEELPASYIHPALDAFEEGFTAALEAEGLRFDSITSTATPRRLVFFAEGIPDETPERTVETAGPPETVAIDKEGNLTAAAEGFARSQGVAVKDLVTKETDRGRYIFAVRTVESRPTRDILAQALPELIRAVPFPKSMYWREPSMRFARPIRRILALFAESVVKFELNGLESGRVTEGHPFLAPGPIEIERADVEELKSKLRDAFVIADRAQRRARILDEVQQALAYHGGELVEEDLLEEVTDLVEWPEVLEGSFSEEYLALPEDVVATAMTDHQRYFPVRDGSGRLVGRFLTVANRTREHCDGIRRGNERVLAARLYDARFFWEADRRTPLEEFARRLDGVVYLAGLGTVADKVERMKKLAAYAAEAAEAGQARAAAVEAAGLSKADLVTEMVGEFPSLQGIMGREYALAEGRDEAVAAAIAEHYMPRTLSGKLPATMPGRFAALADKADTLAGAFVMGLIPSGSQDPYGLRRASVGIIRIIVEAGLPLSLEGLLRKAWALAGEAASGEPKAAFEDLTAFVRERLYRYYLDRGFRHDVLRACMAAGIDDLSGFYNRLEAVTRAAAEPYWDDLVTAVERTFNITRDYEGPLEVAPALFADENETRLYEIFRENEPRLSELIEKGDYAGAGRLFAEALAEPLHTFFDEVYVNVEDARVRSNRLALIKTINLAYSGRVADLALIVRQ